MKRRWRRVALASMAVLYVFGIGLLVGVATERLRYDAERTAVVRRYERLAAERRAQLMTAEHATESSTVAVPARAGL